MLGLYTNTCMLMNREVYHDARFPSLRCLVTWQAVRIANSRSIPRIGRVQEYMRPDMRMCNSWSAGKIRSQDKGLRHHCQHTLRASTSVIHPHDQGAFLHSPAAHTRSWEQETAEAPRSVPHPPCRPGHAAQHLSLPRPEAERSVRGA